jgi:hypothetical protein
MYSWLVCNLASLCRYMMPRKVTCEYCNGRFYPDKLKVSSSVSRSKELEFWAAQFASTILLLASVLYKLCYRHPRARRCTCVTFAAQTR